MARSTLGASIDATMDIIDETETADGRIALIRVSDDRDTYHVARLTEDLYGSTQVVSVLPPDMPADGAWRVGCLSAGGVRFATVGRTRPTARRWYRRLVREGLEALTAPKPSPYDAVSAVGYSYAGGYRS